MRPTARPQSLEWEPPSGATGGTHRATAIIGMGATVGTHRMHPRTPKFFAAVQKFVSHNTKAIVQSTTVVVHSAKVVPCDTTNVTPSCIAIGPVVLKGATLYGNLTEPLRDTYGTFGTRIPKRFAAIQNLLSTLQRLLSIGQKLLRMFPRMSTFFLAQFGLWLPSIHFTRITPKVFGATIRFFC